jgi:hypothetical protein
MKTTRIVLIVLMLGLITLLAWPKATQQQAQPVPVAQNDSIIGCYVATIAKDVYSMNITSQEGIAIEGTLAYKNFEKDSSSGTLVGIYDSQMLLGDYSFASEGMDSVAQVAFKKTPEGFIRGFGPTETMGNKEVLTDTSNLTYENSPTFVKTQCQ